MSKTGVCYLCGKPARLTKDHIQPACAFNERTRRYVRMTSITQQAIHPNRPLSGPRVRGIYHEIQPDSSIGGGIYRHTQCEECNNGLGSNYDSRFGRWCREAVDMLKPGELIIVQREYQQICHHPLSVLKRIAAMFFSINGQYFAKCNPELSRFVREPKCGGPPQKYGFYAAYNINDIVSHIPYQQRLNAKSGQLFVLSQIAHPPFVYVMTFDSPSPDSRLTDITHFADYGYDDEADLSMNLRVLPTNSCLAGDFRAAGPLLDPDAVVFATAVPASYFRLVDTVI